MRVVLYRTLGLWGLVWLNMSAAPAASVLMVSVDGMKPEYVTEADRHGLRVPFLRSVLADGAYAQGVRGVWPTTTYPSHTTLVTGVTPAQHGIFNNLEFDPQRSFAEAWYWYAAEIKAPTLWDAAHRAGLSTASIGWPATVGARSVDYLIPEFWREFRPTAELNPADRDLIAALSRPDDLLSGMEASAGPYLMGNDTGLAADEIKTRYATLLLMQHKPRFMTLHLSSLDSAEHEHGPFSAAANEDLEAVDDMLRRLAGAARSADPAAIVCIVSDHGFAPLTHRVNLGIPFVQAGLIQLSVDPVTQLPRVTAWSAQPWPASGMAAIMLRDPGDQDTRVRVQSLMERLAADPRMGIAEILAPDAIKERGAFPQAAFLVNMKLGYYVGGNLSGAVVTDWPDHGGHGFSPDAPEMRAAFFVSGPGIARHRDLGIVDMRQIAPTVAKLLGVSLPTADAAPLAVRQ